MVKGRLRAGMLPPAALVAALVAAAPRFSGRNHARPLAHYAPLVLGSSAHPRCARISRSTEELATNLPCGAPQADGGGPRAPLAICLRRTARSRVPIMWSYDK